MTASTLPFNLTTTPLCLAVAIEQGQCRWHLRETSRGDESFEVPRQLREGLSKLTLMAEASPGPTAASDPALSAPSDVRIERPLLLDVSPRDLSNFYYYSGAFSAEEIASIDALTARLPLSSGTVGTDVDLTYRVSQVKWIPMTADTAFLYQRVAKLAMEANAKMWRFALSSFKEDAQYTEYDSACNGHYDWHMDLGSAAPTRKLSVSLQLSEPDAYAGGELEFRIHRSTVQASKHKGTLVIFPSYLGHRVAPVTRGMRRSLVFWLHGPPLT